MEITERLSASECFLTLFVTWIGNEFGGSTCEMWRWRRFDEIEREFDEKLCGI
jgi:hypothetical protein